MELEKARIDVGDEVHVNFNNAQTTLCRRARVVYTPCAAGDSWVFADLETGDVHYVSEGCTITKRPNGAGQTPAAKTGGTDERR